MPAAPAMQGSPTSAMRLARAPGAASPWPQVHRAGRLSGCRPGCGWPRGAVVRATKCTAPTFTRRVDALEDLAGLRVRRGQAPRSTSAQGGGSSRQTLLSSHHKLSLLITETRRGESAPSCARLTPLQQPPPWVSAPRSRAPLLGSEAVAGAGADSGPSKWEASAPSAVSEPAPKSLRLASSARPVPARARGGRRWSPAAKRPFPARPIRRAAQALRPVPRGGWAEKPRGFLGAAVSEEARSSLGFLTLLFPPERDHLFPWPRAGEEGSHLGCGTAKSS